jgi:hypothetical protein
VEKGSIADFGGPALRLGGDYLFVPNLRIQDLNMFKPYTYGVQGLIVGIDASPEDKVVHSIADVVVRIVSNKAAPLGIGGLWVRPSRLT